VEKLDNDMLLLQTRRGKTHRIHAHDPQLRHASWWERVRYSARFPQLNRPAASPTAELQQ
jgi:hypothetical protein